MEGYNIIIRLFTIIVYAIFPAKWHDGIADRITEIKAAATSNIELRVFWHILFLPIVLPVSLLIALVKSIFIMISPSRYRSYKYIFGQIFNDVVREKMGVKHAVKRAALANEMLIKGAEKRESFGDKNPDKTFFVIRPYYFMKTNELATTISNLLFHYYRNLQHLSHAIDNGWIPVVDWQNYGPFPHGEDFPVNGTTNCWEYFWNQPSEYTLDEVYKSKNVILSSQNTEFYGSIPSVALTPPFSEYVDDLIACCPKYDTLITLNEPTSKYVQKHQDALFPPDSRILGVSIRGAAYGASNIPGHPVQPKMQNLIAEVKKYVGKWNMDFIFFTCEMASAVEAMRNSFGDKLIVLPRQRYKKLPTSNDNPLYEAGSRYQTNLDYLTEMVLLSRCTSLIAGMSGGVRCAIIWNAGQYEHIKVFENGMW